MPYAVYYPSGCEADLVDHYCNNCETIEGGRVRGTAFIRNDFAFTDPTNPTEWRNGILAKKIIIIPETNGTFDGGSEVEGAGFGNRISTLLGFNFVSVFNDPNYKLNADFYNLLKRSRNYRYAYLTETQVHITTNTVSVIPKNPVADDLNSGVFWNVTVKWAEEDLPVPHDIPVGIFTCFDYTGAIT